MTPAPPAPPLRGREILLAAIFFAALTALMTWPQVLHLGDALSDTGDAKLNARIVQWDFAQTLRDPRRLFQLNFFHPATYVLGFSENLYGVAVFGFPLLAAGASALLNYNVLLLLGMFLSALAAWALARHVTGDPGASLVAGMVYAFLPWRVDQLAHMQHQWGAFLALLLLFLLRYLEEGRRRDLVLYAVAFGWNALANVHFAIFSGFVVVTTLGWFALRARPRGGVRIRNALLATAAGALPFVPFAVGYRTTSDLYHFRRQWGELAIYSGRWTDFLAASPKSRFWGPLTQRWWAPEGQFFPGVLATALAAAATVALWRVRRRGEEPPAPRREKPGAGVRLLDAAILLLAVAYGAAALVPGLTLGPLRLREPARILVILLVVVLVRLLIRFPGRRHRGLAGFLRNIGLDSRAVLLLAIAACGVLAALGIHTPFYRFLFQSFAAIFRAIRVPSRAIVLFDLALAVLAAWGLSLLTRRLAPRGRGWAVAAALAVLVAEYAAFPLDLEPTAAAPAPVYVWLRDTPLPAAVAEWPLGITYDFEYVLRQAAHGKPIVNGYSGFFPSGYADLDNLLKKRPIPEAVWAQLGRLGAGLLVYHSHERRGFQVLAYADLLQAALDGGGLELIRRFPHDDGFDFVFVGRGTPWKEAAARGEPMAPEALRRSYDATLQRLRTIVAQFAPPMGGLHVPAEGQHVSAGFWTFGWALDDSGIVEIDVATELGPLTKAGLGGKWPGLREMFPDYPDSDRGGYGFAMPDLPPGRHTLKLTLVARDGGRTVLLRPFVMESGPGSPRAPR